MNNYYWINHTTCIIKAELGELGELDRLEGELGELVWSFNG